jgi:cytochrome c peroxidase
MRTMRIALVALAAVLLTVAAACKKEEKGKPGTTGPQPAPAPAAFKWEPIVGLFDPVDPEDNPMTTEKVALGKQLFFDKRLSKDGSASCETCHVHDKGWTDGLQFSMKVGGALNTRNTPSLYNVAYQQSFYWDGRAASLEKNIAAAWEGQMGADKDAIAKAIGEIPGYADQFKKVFNGPPTALNIPMAIAAYVRTLRSGNSAWDKYEKGDKIAVGAEAIEGYKIFTGKGQCVLCHTPPLYTDGMFHNVGLEAGKEKPDPGRAKVTDDMKDQSAFKTPSQRQAPKTGPYFHDGSAATLEDAVRFMAGGGKPDANLDPRLKPTNLTDEEIKNVVAFIMSLASKEPLEKPTLP